MHGVDIDSTYLHSLFKTYLRDHRLYLENFMFPIRQKVDFTNLFLGFKFDCQVNGHQGFSIVS